jgi:hypothetical protein
MNIVTKVDMLLLVESLLASDAHHEQPSRQNFTILSLVPRKPACDSGQVRQMLPASAPKSGAVGETNRCGSSHSESSRTMCGEVETSVAKGVSAYISLVCLAFGRNAASVRSFKLKFLLNRSWTVES